jgi:hypothetical protein
VISRLFWSTVKPLYKDALGTTIYILMKRYPYGKKSRVFVESEEAQSLLVLGLFILLFRLKEA